MSQSLPSPWGLEECPILTWHCGVRLFSSLCDTAPTEHAPRRHQKCPATEKNIILPGITRPSSSLCVVPHQNDTMSAGAVGTRTLEEILSCLQPMPGAEGWGLILCLLPCAQSIPTNTTDCKPCLFSAAAEGPGVVLFLGVFWTPLQAVNWRQQKD